jgi:hypothetical protein
MEQENSMIAKTTARSTFSSFFKPDTDKGPVSLFMFAIGHFEKGGRNRVSVYQPSEAIS